MSTPKIHYCWSCVHFHRQADTWYAKCDMNDRYRLDGEEEACDNWQLGG